MIVLAQKLAARLLTVAAAPFVGLTRGVAAGGTTVWGLHALLLAGVLAGLWWLNGWLGLDQVVHAPSKILRQFWLPAVFAFGYASLAAAYATWRVVSEPDAVSPYPELDQAWRHACEALQRGGIAQRDKPLVLVIGQPADATQALVEAAEINPTLGPAPTDSAVPIRVWANDEAIYLACQETSALSACSQSVAAQRRTRRTPVAERPAAVEQRLPAALRVGGGGPADWGWTDEGPTDEGSPDPASRTDGHSGSRIGETRSAVAAGQRPYQPLLTAEQGEAALAQLDHLLALLRRDRSPGLPIDAVVVAVPCDAVDEDQRAVELANAVRSDLDAIQQTAGVRCPVLVLGSELHHVEGCGQLLHTLSTEQRRRLLGVSLPASERRSEAALREAVDWLTESVTPAMCQRLLQIDADNTDYEENTELFRFQTAIAQRREALGEILSRGLAGDGEAWPMVGLYLVATGDALGGSQGFGTGVLSQLTASGGAMWTDEAIDRDRRQARWVTVGYTGVAAATLFVAALLVF